MSKVKSTTRNSKVFKRVYGVVGKIPEGKVATYGQISDLATEELKNQGTEEQKRITPRVVGWALHGNKDSKTPCHRVVNKNGRLAPNFAFDGWKEQKRRLLVEDVKFKDKMHVDLEKCFWSFRKDLNSR